jgi:hypothetical protein
MRWRARITAVLNRGAICLEVTNPLPSTKSALVPFSLKRVSTGHDGDLHNDVAVILPPRIIETLFARKGPIKRHREAPFLSEREPSCEDCLKREGSPRLCVTQQNCYSTSFAS